MKFTLPNLELFPLKTKGTLSQSNKQVPEITIEDQALFESKLKLLKTIRLDHWHSEKSPVITTDKTTYRTPFDLYSRSPKNASNRTNKSLEKIMKDQKLMPYKFKRQFPKRQTILDRQVFNHTSEIEDIPSEGLLSLNLGNRIEFVKTYLDYPGKAKPTFPKAVLSRNANKKTTFKLCSLLTEEERRNQPNIELEMVNNNGIVDYRIKRNQSKKLIRMHKRNLSKTINFQDFKLDQKRLKFSTTNNKIGLTSLLD
jgi:hypothetical protein